MASKIKVDQIEGSTGSSITIPTGQTLTITDGLAASTIGSGTLADARLPTVPVAKGGTGLTSLGSAGQAIKVNSGGNALEFGTISSDYVKLNTTTLGSDVANISIDGHFTSDYKNYFMILNVFPATNNANLIMRFNISNSGHSGSDYRGLISGSERYSSGQNFGNQGTHWYNHSSAYVTGHSGGLNDNQHNGGCRVEQTIYDPLNTTTHTHLTQQHVYNNNANNNIITGFGGHSLQHASAVTGLTYYMDSGNLKAGSTFSLYGLKS